MSIHRARYCIAIGTVLAATLVHAADKTSSFGKGKPGGVLLTRAELRECLAQQGRVRALTDETVGVQAALEKDKAEIARLDAELVERLAVLDRTNADAVDGYNAQVQVRDRLIEAYNARTPAYNAKVDALRSGREKFAKACENRDFDEKDEIAIRKGQ
jgi:hypothetical protein